MIKQTYLVCIAGLLLATAACDQSTGPSNALSQGAAMDLAAALDANSTLGTADVGLGPSFSVNVGESGASASAAVPTTFDNSFTVTKQCPKGGQVGLAGTIAGTGDPATHSLTLDVDATRTDANCAFQTRDGVLTINGNIDGTPNLTYEGHLNIVNGVLVGPQTQTHKGSFTWSRTGGYGSCDVDLTSSFDPATHTATVTGSFCGHIVNVTQTRGG
jgi:hypothetical protein